MVIMIKLNLKEVENQQIRNLQILKMLYNNKMMKKMKIIECLISLTKLENKFKKDILKNNKHDINVQII